MAWWEIGLIWLGASFLVSLYVGSYLSKASKAQVRPIDSRPLPKSLPMNREVTSR